MSDPLQDAPRVLIVEPDLGGHHLHYVHLLVRAFAEFLPRESLIVALPQDGASSPEFKTHLEQDGALATFDCWLPPRPPGTLAAAGHTAVVLRQSIERRHANWLCVPYADGVSQAVGLNRLLLRKTFRRPIHSEALMMRGGFAYPRTSWKSAIASRLSWTAARLAPWDVLYVLDPVVYEKIAGAGVRLLPDPVEAPVTNNRSAARRRLGLPDDGRIAACVGMIDCRKGVDRLIRAFAAARLNADDRLLLVGRQAPEIRQLLAGEFAPLVQSGRAICLDRTVSTDELVTAVEACDMMCALYPRHIGSASIVIRAAAARRPSLGHSFGWLGEIIPRFQLGWTCDVNDSQQLPAALRNALERSTGFELSLVAKRFVAFNTIENFAAHWTANLRQRLGLPQASAYRDWESVH